MPKEQYGVSFILTPVAALAAVDTTEHWLIIQSVRVRDVLITQ